MKLRLLPAIALLVPALAACGGAKAQDDGVVSAGGGTAAATPAASTAPSLDPQEAALKFAQCMRENGIDMQDPQEGRIQLKVPKGMDPKKMEKAQKTCQPIMDSAIRDRGAPDPREYDQMVKFAQCMRKQGIDMPDPKPGEGIRMRATEGSQARMEAAHKACEQYAPGGPRKSTP